MVALPTAKAPVLKPEYVPTLSRPWWVYLAAAVLANPDVTHLDLVDIDRRAIARHGINAAEVLDTFYPLFRLREDGYQVDVAGPEARVYHTVQHDRHPEWARPVV